jgi:FKBP-type peptidyl-prolyl cis-trans isomerase (trigger factor)
LNYSKKDFPPNLQHKDSKKRPSILEIEIVDIKEKVLPQIDNKFIKEKF